MCKGTVLEKANILFDVIESPYTAPNKLPENEGNEERTICWSSSRMRNAFKKLVFYSEIFPKKYQNEFLTDLLRNKHNE